jgi:hypothetical protein
MLEMIKERRLSDDKDERRDLLSNFIAANETEDAKFKLSDRELIANVFMFLIAGHEVRSILQINAVLTHLNVDHGTHTLFRVGQSRTISG